MKLTRSISTRLFVTLLTLVASTIAFAEEGAPPSYGIQPGDVLDVSVWREPDLQREVLVRADGGISFPLVGDISATGMSVAELSKAISSKLEKFIPDPVVTVSLRQMAGNKIYVLGRVNRPGEFAVIRPVSVLQALAMAGGLTPYADEKKIRILRGEIPDQQSMDFNYRSVERGEQLEQNIVLQPGDVIVVP